jgi:hypothetical protein
MPNRKPNGTGMLALLAGVAAGAAAIFFSKPENREMVRKEARKAEIFAKKEARIVEKTLAEDSKKARKVVLANVKSAKAAVRTVKSKAKKLAKKR